MTRTVDVSRWPTRAFQYVFASFLVFGAILLSAFVLDAVLTRHGIAILFLNGLTGIVVFAVLWISLTTLWVRHLRRADGEWWAPFPREQYLGRLAGHGGLARHSWGRAVERLPDDEED